MLSPQEHLILKYLKGTLSPEEKTTFEEWLRADEAHQQLVWDFQKLYQISDIPRKPNGFDTAGEWAKLEAAVNREEDKKIIPLRPRTYAIAAAVALFFVASFALYMIAFRASEVVERTTNMTRLVVLPDGSSVTLNENSVLTYEKDFEERELLLEGEAFFDVKPDAAHPFVIHTRETEVKVLGTSFNVRAYAEEKNTEVFVVTGKVKFSAANLAANAMTLMPGNKGVYRSAERSLQSFHTEDLNATAWKEKRLVFKKTLLSEVVVVLKAYFKTDILIKNESISNCRFTSTFEDPTLSEVMETLSLALNLKVEQQGSTYTLEGEGCNIK